MAYLLSHPHAQKLPPSCSMWHWSRHIPRRSRSLEPCDLVQTRAAPSGVPGWMVSSALSCRAYSSQAWMPPGASSVEETHSYILSQYIHIQSHIHTYTHNHTTHTPILTQKLTPTLTSHTLLTYVLTLNHTCLHKFSYSHIHSHAHTPKQILYL